MNDEHSPPQPKSAASRDLLHRLLVLGSMVVILSLAAFLRLTGWDWDEGFLLHPDDRFVSWVTADISFNRVLGVETIHDITSLADYFDTTYSTLNPNNVGHGFYVYGDLPVVVTRLVAEQVGKTSLYEIYEVGRKMAAASDLLTILFLFLTARRLFDERVGVIAAGLYTFAAFPIQQSHFYTSDTFTTMFAMAAFWFAARACVRHNWLDYPLFGLMLGGAMASKISIAPLALILIVALGLRIWREGRQSQTELDSTPHQSPIARRTIRAGLGLAIAAIVTMLVFRIAMPYAFLPPGSDISIDEAALGSSVATISHLLDPVGFRPNPEWLRQMRDVRFQVSGYADIPPNHQWAKRLPLVFPWLNTVRIGMGWPLGLFAWLSLAWALWEIVRAHRGAFRLVLPVLWVVLYFIWFGSGWVTTMRYFLPIYAPLLMLAAWAMVTLWERVGRLLSARDEQYWHPVRLIASALIGIAALSGILWGISVFQIYTRPHTRVAASQWMVQNISSDVTLVFDTPSGEREYQVGFWNDWPPLSQQAEDLSNPQVQYSYVDAGVARSADFELPFDGTLTGIRLYRVVDPLHQDQAKTLDLLLTVNDDFTSPLVSETLTDTFAVVQDDPRGSSVTVPVPPIGLSEGQPYKLTVQPGLESPLVFSGSTLALEDTWDDAIPLSVEGRNIWSMMYQGYTLEVHWEDTPEKRTRLQHILDNSDYIVISSNRFYATLNRNPERWPMTIDYYQALFSGTLGFDLVADFTSRPSLGPIQFHDDTAEEAWTVYDHPRVFIFRKNLDYNPEQTAAVLGQADLDTVVRAVAPDAKGHPAKIPLPRQRGRATPGGGTDGGSGTIIEYDPQRADIWSRFQPLTVVVWWMLIGAIGWVVFPVLWVLFPGLPDRGFAFSRIVGLLLVAWATWMAASVGLARWSRGTILLMLAVLFIVSALILWKRRSAFTIWLHENNGHLWLVEGGLLALYLLFVLIRLGNPDLWHPAFGGEKPMDLAYFNAVLRSSTFPPYDPWFAGGRINYYYFGFVLVGVPVKLLSIPSTLAYNLILPAWYAMTGAGAFGAAFNLVAKPTEVPAAPEPQSVSRLVEVLKRWPQISIGDIAGVLALRLKRTHLPAGWPAYAAGLAALLLAVVLGNLDQIRTVFWGLAEFGHGSPQWANTYLPPLGDVLRGLSRTMQEGQPLPIGLGEWYWNATRLIPVPINESGQPTEVGPITEFPFFTFLYADLHAHMIAMPITLATIGWSTGIVKNAAHFALEDARHVVARWGSRAMLGIIGALIIGVLRPTNTWDYPTYLVLGFVAVVVAVFVRRGSEPALRSLAVGGLLGGLLGGAVFAIGLNGGTGSLPFSATAGCIGLMLGFGISLRLFTDPYEEVGQGLVHWGSLIGGGALAALLAGATSLFFLPYIQNYQLGYDKVIPWEGSRTPLWSYLDILGLFLLVITTWLLIEIGGWLSGRLKRKHALPILLILGGLAAVTLVAVRAISPVAGIALPMMIATLTLYLRRGVSIEKRLLLVLIIGALALTLVVEILVLQGDLSRMNTVFKFYLQVWLLMAVAAGAAFGWLWPHLRQAPEVGRIAWSALAGILVFLAALYPLMATRAKITDRWNSAAPHTLDGMASLSSITYSENGATFSLAGDYEALRWLQDNIAGYPVILEGLSWREYLWGSRVSVYTGLQSIVGWNWHQRQQRPPQAPDVFTRHADVAGIYDTASVSIARDLLQQYGVNLIYVGELEKAYYDPAGLAKFDDMVADGFLHLLYDRKGTRIYEVVDGPATGGSR